MITKDAEKFDEFIEHVSGSTSFNPWLDEYDPFTETGVAFVHGGDEDNGQFSIGDIDLDFGKVDFTYKDVLDGVIKYRNNCEDCIDPESEDADKEYNYLSELDELVDSLKEWCGTVGESKKSCSMTKKIESLRKTNESQTWGCDLSYEIESVKKDGRNIDKLGG